MNELEHGAYADLTDAQAKHLVNQGLIYSVGSNSYRFADGIVYTDIEFALKGISNE